MNYDVLKFDSSVFIKQNSDWNLYIILDSVDVQIFISNELQNLNHEVYEFLNELDRTEESLNWYLGVHIVMTKDKIDMSKTAYIEHTLKNIGLEEISSYKTPMIQNFFD